MRKLLITRWYGFTAAVMALTLFAAGTVIAKEQSATINASVAAGKTHITRLRNLPEGAFLSVKLKIDGQVKIMLLDELDVRRFPAVRDPAFSGETSDKLGFGVKIPRSGTYYIFIDNRQGNDERHFSLSVTGSSPDSSADTEDYGQKLTEAEEQLAKFEKALRRYFIFDDLKLRIAQCGTSNAFSNENTVIICAEMARKLYESMGSKAKASDALLFAMMHEVGHVLLRQWGYPLYDNEDAADEFATAILVLFNQGDRARSQAEFLSKVSPEKEFALKIDRNDRHSLSVQRARNILGWLDDPELLIRWQKIFIPHMQTDVLQAMTRSTKPWIDQKLVAQELSLRSK